MRLLSKVAIGGSVLSATTLGVLTAVGVFATSATLVVTDPVAPQAEARPGSLRAFDNCRPLLDWYIAHGVQDVGPYGWNSYDPWSDLELRGTAVLDSTASTARSFSRSPSSTGTNTQEDAVDETDVAKTNGTLVVRVSDDRRLVVIDVTASPRVLARFDLPAGGFDSQVLLIGDHVLVTQQTSDAGSGGRSPRPFDDLIDSRISPYGAPVTRILDIDVSTPAHPALLSADRYTGSLVAARQYGDTVRVVTSTARPALAWALPSKKVSRAEAVRRNRALVRATTLDDWLPAVTRNGQRRPLVDCADVYRPEDYAGAGTLTVTTFPITDVGARTSVAITTDGELTYSSGDRLYVASTDYAGGWDDGWDDGWAPRRRSGREQVTTTALHAFDITGPTTSYVGSGEIRGSVRDRWSLDEEGGDLRVAWSTSNARGATNNGVTVLTERDGALVPVGRVADLGIDEDIQSVRWLGDLAIVVTFRQTDPLYTLDLSDPTHPRVLGKLKIPGYSGYLHPIGDHLLLGLGLDADSDGNTRGTQAAVFDISDVRHPRRVSQLTWGRDTWFSALDDPHGFSWNEEDSTATTTLYDWSGPDTRLVGLHVDPDGTLSRRPLAPVNRDWQPRTLPLGAGRLAVVDHHRVRVVDLTPAR